ncbi:hypothetical protein SprV_0501946200 [Sparganum proliferum]
MAPGCVLGDEEDWLIARLVPANTEELEEAWVGESVQRLADLHVPCQLMDMAVHNLMSYGGDSTPPDAVRLADWLGVGKARIQAVNTSPIVVFVSCFLSFNPGLLRLFPRFFVASTPPAILGTEFLAADLLVDWHQSCLHNQITKLKVRFYPSPASAVFYDPASRERIIAAVQKLRNDKVPADDGIPSEVDKSCLDTGPAAPYGG